MTDTVAELLIKLGVPDVQTAYEQAHQLGRRVWELAGDAEPDDPNAVSGSLLERAAQLLAGDADHVFIREQWTAALRWATDLRGEPTRAPGAVLDGLANQIEAGYLTPWADTPEPSTPPAQPAHTPRAAAGGHPGTLDGPGVLGRALRFADGSVGAILDEQVDAWRRAHPKAGRFPLPATEVLLVDPATMHRLHNLERAARDLVGQQRHPDPDTGQAEIVDAEQALADAVDALEPAPEPAGDGPGWDRELVRSWCGGGPADPVEIRANVIHALAEIEQERDAARRQAANLFALAEQRFRALEKVSADLDAARAELAEVTADRDRMRADMFQAIGECNAANRELATARRDAACAALEVAAHHARARAADEGIPQERRHLHAEYAEALQALAAEFRSSIGRPAGGEASDSIRGVLLMSAADGFPPVSGRCPACRGASLFMTDSGVTCAWSNCPDPYAAETADMAASSPEPAGGKESGA